MQQHPETPQDPFAHYPTYDGDDLGLTYSPTCSIFKVWSPAVTSMEIIFYDSGEGGHPLRRTLMQRDQQGVWIARFEEDLTGIFYVFQTTYQGVKQREVPDPYVRAVGVNGQRGQVVDLDATHPTDWEKDQRPVLVSKSDAIIWEVHLRDLSIHDSAGIRHKGKLLGLTETGTRSPLGEKTGLDHIKELGVTHVHLLPVFDYHTVDEHRLHEPQFNWGYDPQHYNVPEGSYSTNPYDGATRIREFKQMVKTLHDNGLRVVMDVVYNHTGQTEHSVFNQIAPHYYYRQREDGSYSNASGCGNETASERTMMRKFIIDSLRYWVEMYHVDGFRIDLMGIHDIETLNQLSAILHEIEPSILLYGEGWTAGDSPLPPNQRALKKHTRQLDRIAAFSDDMRDGLKGSVFQHQERGYISGRTDLVETIKFGIVGATAHPQIDYQQVNYSSTYWCNAPTQCINYASCHDNHTLWDRLTNSNTKETDAERIKMQMLAGAIVLSSQGIPFLHAGTSMLRTKSGVENSYCSPDDINQIRWEQKTHYKNVFRFYQQLITIRRQHPAFRMPTTALVQRHLRFLPLTDPHLIGYQLCAHANEDRWQDILVFFNNHPAPKGVDIPAGRWRVVVDGAYIDSDATTLVRFPVSVSGRGALILANTGQ
ncbi:MAG: type I pullulanase [Bacteroidota bacterium]